MATTRTGSSRDASLRQVRAALQTHCGLTIETRFCPPDVADPFDTVEWETRSAASKDEAGGVLFEQNECEVPSGWSQLATNVVVSKYFYGENGTPERERSVRQLIDRVTRTIADWGWEDGYFASDTARGFRFELDAAFRRDSPSPTVLQPRLAKGLGSRAGRLPDVDNGDVALPRAP